MEPLGTLLSQALVAFTIEADNELERRLPHVTTAKVKRAQGGQSLQGPWLTSLVMWANFLQFVEASGTPVEETRRRAGLGPSHHRTIVGGMTRWGYVTVDASKPPVVRPTVWGRRAQELWPEVLADVGARWTERHGDGLAGALSSVAVGVDGPPFLPMVNYANGLRVIVEAPGAGGADLGLAGLLSRVLLAVTLRYEAEHELSLALAANALRVLRSDEPTLVADVPVLTGTSKEAVSYSLGRLEKTGLVALAGSGRTKAARLTAAGAAAQEQHLAAVSVEDPALAQLRPALEDVVAALDLAALAPPGTWRATEPPRRVLPHHPMVLHRGGYPDGS